MDRKESIRQISAIVPAHNEAERIGHVLKVLTSYKNFHEIIVVNDGSTDDTEKVIKEFPVRYIINSSNHGKAHAMQKGVDESKGDIIFFCDADISGLTHAMIDSIVNPVTTGKYDMFVGMRGRGWYGAHSVLAFVPILGGERAMTKELWQDLPEFYKDRFKIETGLNFYAKYHKKGYSFKVIHGLTQVIKEKKYGLAKGMYQRFGMYKDILLSQVRLELKDIPYNPQQGFYSLYGLILSLFFVALGVQLLLIIKTQPDGLWYTIIQNNFSVPDTNVWDYFLSLIKRRNQYNLGTIAVVLVAIGGLSAIFYLNRVVRFFKKTRQK